MNTSLQRFNLVRIQHHFNVAVQPTAYRRGRLACDGKSFQNRPLRARYQITYRALRAPVAGDFQRNQTIIGAPDRLKNEKEIKVVTKASDSRRSPQIGSVIRDGIR